MDDLMAYQHADSLPITADAMAVMRRMEAVLIDLMRQSREDAQRIERMERLIKRLTPATPAQLTALKNAIGMRSHELCMAYGMEPDTCRLRLMGNLIRADVKGKAGIRAMRELPRCEVDAYIRYISLWDDYEKIKASREESHE